MSDRRTWPRLLAPVTLTAMLLLAALAGAPGLSDPVTGTVPSSLRLEVPPLYLILAPVFTLWDGVSMLSMSRLQGFLIGLVLLYLLWRYLTWWRRGTRVDRTKPRLSLFEELRTLAVTTALFLVFVVTGALWHRPMLSLAGTHPDDIVVDFHGHTNVSHDVQNTWMQGFDAEANRRWHARAGFDAAFITDHNTVEGLEGRGTRGQGRGTRDQGPGTGEQGPETRAQGRSTVLCPGIEVSAWRAHIVLLGDTLPVDRRRYNGSLDELLVLLRTSDSAYGALSVASLPEYRRNHWGRLDLLTRAGLDGFEIVNAAPKANEITRSERDSVIAFARAHNRFLVGVSDTHGWGATSMVWNLVRGPAGSADVCATVLGELQRGFPAVQVIERHRLRPDAWWPMWLTPLGVVWETWRSMGWALVASWVAWIWAVTLWWRRKRRMVRDPTRPPSAGRS
jgi:hypothetical protein